MDNIKSERDKLQGETSRLKDAQLRLASLMETKRQSQSERQEQLEEVRKAAAEISRNVTDLSELITKLDKAVADNTGLGAYEKQVAAAPVARAAVPAPVSVPALAPAPGPSSPVQPQPVAIEPPAGTKPDVPVVVAALPKAINPTIELAPQGGGLSANPSRLMPAIPFHQAKGHLPLPAQGRRVISFGERMPSGGTSKGIVVETRQGAQITAPCDGWVLYASDFLFVRTTLDHQRRQWLPCGTCRFVADRCATRSIRAGG